jgi:hypothetical protein
MNFFEKRIILIFVILFSLVKSQQSLIYAPALSDIFLRESNEKKITYNNSKFIQELRRITAKTYYNKYYFSNNTSGSDTFVSLQILPLEKKVLQLFGTKISLEYLTTQGQGIPLNYRHSFSNENYELKNQRIYNTFISYIFIEDENNLVKINFPLSEINPAIKRADLTASFIINSLETEVTENQIIRIKLKGVFDKAFYLKLGYNSLFFNELMFEFTNNQLQIKIRDYQDDILLNTFPHNTRP